MEIDPNWSCLRRVEGVIGRMRHFVDDQFDFLQVLAIHDALRVDKKNRLTYKQVKMESEDLSELFD